MAHRIKKNPQFWDDLRNVVTVPEAARLAGVHPFTIRWHIDNNNVAAVKVGSIWLLSRRSIAVIYPHVSPENDIYVI